MAGQVGWNTVFTIAQTIVVAALMVIVTQDGQGRSGGQNQGGQEVSQSEDSETDVN